MNGYHGRLKEAVAATARMLSALSLITFLMAATPAFAQVARHESIPWPAAHVVPQVTPQMSLLVSSRAGAPHDRLPLQAAVQASRERGATERFLTTAAAAGVSSVLGLHAGVAIGYEHGGSMDLGGAFLGGFLGSSAGAATAAGLLNGNWGRTILGSMVGVWTAAIVGTTVGEGSSSEVGLVTYGLTHGIVTTLIGGW